jgi:cyclic beta-1,2-glucan synthetase
VRENGGQYSHAAVWALMAQAERGDTEAAYRYFGYLSPAHRSRHPTRGPAYEIEPYVMAGDVYTAPPYVGRGGWSWYTGSAAWLHRAAVESMFGLAQHGDEISFTPALPDAWNDADIVLTRAGKKVRFLFARPNGAAPAAQAAAYSALLLQRGERLRWSALPPGACYLVPLGSPTGEAKEVTTPSLAQPG